ncbi:2-hydroxyacid dehydrogenase [Frankia gtarii]|uniref:2-hydroxyacid dehydrogenase n=1 Tax=Frankia gtarii TaxID=2950102 RepID=UPI0021C1F789|nr:D-glycerate dehydrogenase [Frankia gtarii]
MARVLFSAGIPKAGLNRLESAGFELVPFSSPSGPGSLAAQAADADAVLCLLTDRIDEAVLAAGSGRLRVVANIAVGVDNIDLESARRHGVVVCNTPNVLDETTADLTWALILMACRQTPAAEISLRAGRWSGWRIDGYLGRDVHGAVLGLVGWGGIAKAVARRAAGFGMSVLHHARTPSGAPGYVADLEDLLASADIVSLHVPLTTETRHLIDARRLRLMKPTAVLVNTARGPVVDEDALSDALEANQLFAAGLDVYDGEPAVNPRLLAAPRAVLLPHVGSATVETRTAMAVAAADAIVRVLRGDPSLDRAARAQA